MGADKVKDCDNLICYISNCLYCNILLAKIEVETIFSRFLLARKIKNFHSQLLHHIFNSCSDSC